MSSVRVHDTASLKKKKNCNEMILYLLVFFIFFYFFYSTEDNLYDAELTVEQP